MLNLDEAPRHPANVERAVFVEVEGVIHPNAAPRLDRTPGAVHGRAAAAGEHTDEILTRAGLSSDEIAALKADGAVA